MSNIDFRSYESYLLAEDKQQFINSLIPGTAPYFYFLFLHALNTQEKLSTEFELQLEEFTRSYSGDLGAQSIDIRHLLKKFDHPQTDEKEKLRIIQEINDKYLYLHFDHSKPSHVASSTLQQEETKLPNKLTTSIIELEKEKAKVYTDRSYLTYFKPEFFNKFDTKRIAEGNIETFEHFLRQADPTEFDDYLDLIVKYTERLRTRPNDSLRTPQFILSKLTLDQLTALGKKIPDLIKDQSYVTEVFYREFKIPRNKRIGENLPKEERRDLLLKVYSWAKELPQVTQSLAFEALDEILQLGIQLNKYSKDLFIEYLKRPARVYSHYNEKHYKNISSGIIQWSFFNKNDWISQDTLIKSYLEELFKKADSIAPFDEYIDSKYLKDIFYTAKLLQGETVNDINNILSSDKLKTLAESKEITICKYNREYYRSADEVKITLEIKNIPYLLVKVFEFCPENFYLKENKDLDGTINLDGLIASEEHTYEFKEAPVKKFLKEFAFESISKKARGIFIIDFIGNGISTRAIIKKGKLIVIEQATVAGQVFQIVDEEKNICKGERTGLWASGKFYKTDEEGRILIPYSNRTTIQAILVHEDFSERAEIELKAEVFDFKCAFIYNHESILMGNKAKVIIQPRLFINDQPIGLDILKSCSAVVTTYTDTNIPTNTPFDKLKPSAYEDLEIEFPVPAKIQRINITLKASVPKINKKEEAHEFNCSHSIPIDLHLNRMEFCQLFLKYSETGYEIYVLGKNGEPKSKLSLQVTLQHKHFNQTVTETLQTDEKGKVVLGHLSDIVSIYANLVGIGDINSIYKEWLINSHKRINYPEKIYLCEGDNIVLPLLHNELSKHKITFVETLETQEPLKNILSSLKIDNKRLIVSGLPSGFYNLRLKDVDATIQIQVLKGAYWKHNQNYVSTEKALYNVKNQVNNIVIGTVDVATNSEKADKKDIVINAYADLPKLARFHVFAGQFLNANMNKAVTNLDSIAPSIIFEKIPTELRKAFFLNNRKLGDEYVYVLDRKTKTRYIGNTLERPQVLLKRTFVQDTTTKEEDLAGGQEYHLKAEEERALDRERAEGKAYKESAARLHKAQTGSKGGRSINDSTVESNLNFLANPCLIYSNLKLNESGQIILKDFPVGQYSHIHIIGTNLTSNISEIIPLPSTDVPTKDLTLKSQLKKDSFYSINRGSTKVSKSTKFQLKDLTSTEIQVVDSIPKLFDIQKALILCNGSDSENGGFDFWNFLKDWPTLSEEEKLKKYDKYSCHEVNIFLYFKDSSFFKTVVRPFIKNKIEKTVVDHALLENEQELLKRADITTIQSLNQLEVALIVYVLRNKHPEVAKSIASKIESEGKLIKIQTNTFKRFFDTVLNSKTEGDALAEAGFGGGSMPIMQQAAFSNVRSMNRPMMAQNIQQQIPMSVTTASSNAQFDGALFSMSNVGYSAAPQMQMQMRSQMPMQSFGIQKNAMDMDFLSNNVMLQSADLQLNDDFAGGEYLEKRAMIRGGFQELEKTKEYCERNYYGKTYSVSIALNLFWVDLVKHLVENGLEKPFLTQNFIYANTNQTELIGVLSFMSLPFQAGNHAYTSYEGRGLQIEAASDAIIFHKEISEGKAEMKPEILISQRFFDPKDRYTESEEDPGVEIEKEVDQYVINKIYGCKVTVTNCSVASQEVQVLIEIPEGSLPVYQIDYTKSHTIRLNSTGNSTIESYFYFPNTGKFKVYPSNVSKNGRVMAQATEKEFDVQASRTYTSLESFTAVLTQGSEDDILNFVRNKNIFDSRVFNFSEIWWLLKKKDFWAKFIQVCRDRKIFDYTTWTFAFHHKDAKGIQEFFKSSHNPLDSRFLYLESSLMKINKLTLREYNPFVNPRVHLLASEKNQILNVQFREQYRTFIKYLCEVNELKTEHYLPLVYYLLLQDRIDDAIKFFNKIKKEDVAKSDEHTLQYDYFAAYLDFYTGYPKFTVARETCMKYLTYPVLSWRSLFIDIANQLAEFDGDEMIEDEFVEESEKKQNIKNAEKEEILNMELEATKLNITYQNIKEITLFFYKVDLEILFSRNPFLSQSKDEFAFIKPNHSHRVTVQNGTELQKVQYEIPPNLQKSNVFIQLRTDNRTLSTTYFSTSLKVQIIENYGQVKVLDENDKPLTKVYVKSFAKTKSGKVSFYKDGYTDLRGRFDYATLNSGDVSNIEKFAILIISDELGSLTKEANAPNRLGRVEGNPIIRSKNVKYDKYQNDPIQKEMVSKNKK